MRGFNDRNSEACFSCSSVTKSPVRVLYCTLYCIIVVFDSNEIEIRFHEAATDVAVDFVVMCSKNAKCQSSQIYGHI
jgi:hypothetical protein